MHGRRRHHPLAPLLSAFLNEIVGARHSSGAYAILEIRAPAGFVVPRHVHQGHLAHLNVVEGAIEVIWEDEPPAIISRGTVTVKEGRPVSGRVLEDVRIVAVLAPAGEASLLPAA